MDRLRSPGGCPWDAQQTHDSLAPYLLEEAYEAFQAIEDDDSAALREELGDVLLQVAFHARLAEERDEPERWTIDDVAAGLVDKLVRRHPHVFGDVEVEGADEVITNWDAIKAAEKGRASAVDGVPMSSPALTLAQTLQRKAAKLGVPADLLAPELAAAEGAGAAIAALAAAYDEEPTVDSAGALLWAIQPRVVIANNGPRKGMGTAAFDRIQKIRGLEGLWQSHLALANDRDHNAPDDMIANVEASTECSGHWIRVDGATDGSFVVTNSRNDVSRTYKRR